MQFQPGNPYMAATGMYTALPPGPPDKPIFPTAPPARLGSTPQAALPPTVADLLTQNMNMSAREMRKMARVLRQMADMLDDAADEEE